MLTSIKTINVYDKGHGTYHLLDCTDNKPLYKVLYSEDVPHMTIYRASDRFDPMGTATFTNIRSLLKPSKCQISLTIDSRITSLNKVRTGFFANSKRALHAAALGEQELYWKSRSTGFGILELVDGRDHRIASFKNSKTGAKLLGRFEIEADVDEDGRDEIVVSGLAVLQEEMTSMGTLAMGIVADVDRGYNPYMSVERKSSRQESIH